MAAWRRRMRLTKEAIANARPALPHPAGVDDGAASLDEALAMARFCVRDGHHSRRRHPHCHRHCRLLRADILPHVARLNEALTDAGVPLAILPGSEVQVTDTAAYRRECMDGLYCNLGDRPAFTLLEFSLEGRTVPGRRG